MRLSENAQKKIVEACRRGTSIDDAARQFGVSPSTVDRLLRRQKISLRRGRPTKLRALLQTETPGVDEVFRCLRRLPFPYPEKLAATEIKQEIEKLSRVPLYLDDNNMIRPQSRVGLKICYPFFPNRYASKQQTLSALEGWENDNMLRKAIEFQIKCGDPVEPHRVLRALTLMCRTPSIFRPAVARFVYERLCRRGRTWDPCAGYGGRLLGAHSAGVQYVGTDVEEATIEGNRALASEIGFSAELHHVAAENFRPPKVDLVFTSPPYFDREKYSDSEAQSWRRHGNTLEAWFDGFLVPLIERARDVLSSGGHLALNVADLRERGRVLSIVSKTVAAALTRDFTHVETLQMPIAAINRESPSEPILVFRKR